MVHTACVSGKQLFVCGSNREGKLGFNSGFDDDCNVFTNIVSDQDFIQVSCGVSHTAAIDIRGRLWVCGNNSFGQLGVGDANPGYNLVLVDLDVIFIEVSCGGRQTAALDELGQLWVSGNNNTLFERVTIGNKIVTISCGTEKLVAIDNKGSVWCVFGKNVSKMNPDYDELMFSKICSGGCNIVAIDTIGRLWFWGSNIFTETGFFAENLTLIPTSERFVDVSIRSDHCMAIDQEGNLWTCGENNYGQLGLNDKVKRYCLTRVQSTRRFLEVVASFTHTLALDTKRRLWVCGDNSKGQLGLGDYSGKLQLEKVPEIRIDSLSEKKRVPIRQVQSALSTVY